MTKRRRALLRKGEKLHRISYELQDDARALKALGMETAAEHLSDVGVALWRIAKRLEETGEKD